MRLTAAPSGEKGSCKRTRIVVTQSKYGCFTCKSRRVKCDESKPQCFRCQRSNVECEGYPSRAYSESENELSPEHSDSQAPESQFDVVSTRESHPTYALLDGFRGSHTQDRLARLGCSILRGGLHDQFEASRALFECLLPQLSYALPSVNAAAAALGAVYEMQTTSLSTSDDETRLIATQYGTAIREVQLELLRRPYGPVPILVACVLLACTDVLLRRPRIALIHFRGAIKLLEERNATSTSTSVSRPTSSSGGVCNDLAPKIDPLPLEEEDDDITVFLRTLDVQTVLYADGLEPQMHIALVGTPQDLASSTPNSIYRAGRELIALIQACHCFTSFASQYKYCPRIFVPAELFIEQGRQIAALKLWLRRLDYIILPSIKPSADSSSTASSKYAHGLMLRNLCLSNIIYASSVLNPYETDWDVHAGDFQEIVIGAESILDNWHSKQCGTPSSQTSAFTFTPSPGIIQPLFLTALKYREPRWRRRALALLWQSGKEGPWDGKLIAAAIQRTIEIEEVEIVRDTESSIGKGQVGALHDEHAGREHLANIVPERVRISGCGPGNHGDAGDISDWEWTKQWIPVNREGSMDRWNVSPVSFCRCRDMDKMLAEGLNEKACGKEAPWKDDRHWETWTETVEF